MIITEHHIVGVSVNFQSSGFPRPQIPESSFFLIQEDKARQGQEIVILLTVSSRANMAAAAANRTNKQNTYFKTKTDAFGRGKLFALFQLALFCLN